jgi:hypothetical protein
MPNDAVPYLRFRDAKRDVIRRRRPATRCARTPQELIVHSIRYTAVLALVSFAACYDTPLPTATTVRDQAHAVAARQAIGQQVGGMIPGEYIVVYKRDVADAPGHTRRLIARENARLLRSYGHALNGFAAGMSAEAAERVARDPAVAYVEQNRIIRGASTQTSAPWGLDRMGPGREVPDEHRDERRDPPDRQVVEDAQSLVVHRSVAVGDPNVRPRPRWRVTRCRDCANHSAESPVNRSQTATPFSRNASTV